MLAKPTALPIFFVIYLFGLLPTVEGEGPSAGFHLPSPSLSSMQETRAAEALLRRMSALGEGDVDRIAGPWSDVL